MIHWFHISCCGFYIYQLFFNFNNEANFLYRPCLFLLCNKTSLCRYLIVVFLSIKEFCSSAASIMWCIPHANTGLVTKFDWAPCKLSYIFYRSCYYYLLTTETNSFFLFSSVILFCQTCKLIIILGCNWAIWGNPQLDCCAIEWQLKWSLLISIEPPL